MGRISQVRMKLTVTGAMLAYVGIVYLLPFTCPILALTGIPCPGCGLTRAWLAALGGRFAEAFAFHPLFWAVPVLLLSFWLDGRLLSPAWANRLLHLSIGLGFVLIWLGRLGGFVAFC